MLISETYQIVTEESAIDGDYAESGFNFEGRKFGFRELVEYIQDEGFGQTSSWPARVTDWLSTVDDEVDYQTGERTSKNLHFDGPPHQLKYWEKAMRATGLL